MKKNNFEEVRDTFAWLEKQYKPQGKTAFEPRFKTEDFKSEDWCVSKVDGKTHNITHNPNDSNKPKFKVGDWIVSDYNNVAYIESIGETKYNLQCKDGHHEKMSIEYIDRCWHLWSIEDAKDGDILWHSDSASNGIFIFKEIRHDGKILCYCDYDSEDHFCNGEYHTCCWSNDKYIKPATKEQRYRLFAKMKDAGYEWDEKMKELKKIVQKSAWSEDDEVKINRIAACLENLNVADNDILLKDVDWLKSLKQKYVWKPSDEQMKALKEACDENWEPDGLDPLYELYEQLKKIKENKL